MSLLNFTWFPPDTVTGITSLELGSDPYLVTDVRDLSGLPSEPATSRGPFQPGETLLDNRVSGRRFSVFIEILSDNESDYWDRRDELSHAFSVVPRFDQRTAETGLLRLTRAGQDDIELPCVPVNAPRFENIAPLFLTAEISFFSPGPWWRSISDLIEFFESSGGVAIPHSSEPDPGLAIDETDGLAIQLDQETVLLNNDGHVPTPFTLTITGQVEDPRLLLLETGEELGLIGTIPNGQKVRISTEFGGKEITLIDSDGNESNAFNMLNPDRANFFWLRRGSNTLSGTFASNVNGSMSLTWRKRFSGA